MSGKQQRIQYLLKTYSNRTHTREELEELFGYIREARYDEVLYAFMETQYRQLPQAPGASEPDWEQMFSYILEQPGQPRFTREQPAQKHIRSTRIRYAAAVVILAAGTCIYTLIARQKRQQPSWTSATVINVAPGTSKAILTLADGSSVQLDSAGQKQIQQGNTAIQQQGALLQYEATKNAAITAYNTLTTPRGGQYHLILSDGTQVWLNAASSIRYPIAFSGERREVTVTGEVYFEVKHDGAHPFITKAGNQTIEDIGTAFDVNSYDDEPEIKTTLLQGAVKINDRLLHPGEQAVTTGTGLQITKANTDQVMAWKNGLFYFEDNDFASAMKTLSRWYDIDIVYKGDVPKQHFEGEVPRNYNLGDLLAILKASNVHFTLEGKKLVITQ